MEYIASPNCLEDRPLVKSKYRIYYNKTAVLTLEPRSRYNILLEEDNIVKVVVIKVNSKLYNSDKGAKNKELIRAILVVTNLR